MNAEVSANTFVIYILHVSVWNYITFHDMATGPWFINLTKTVDIDLLKNFDSSTFTVPTTDHNYFLEWKNV